MSITPTKRQENTGARRQAILVAARKVFARQGYAATVVDDVAVEAGIGKGTLYLYFPSKEQIYLTALLEDARELDRLSREAMAAAPGWREKLKAYIDVKLGYFDTNPEFVRIYMTEFRNMCMHGKPLASELYHLVQEGEARLAQVFAAAAAKGEIRQVDPELAATTVTDL